jgi:hypothetical protein
MLNQFASLARVDFAPPHRQPAAGRVLLATIASIAGSLAADAMLVVIGKAIFPSTRDFAHFQFSDYAKLTVIGVIIACVAWPVVTRISSAPRWLFFRLAILVTLVLLLPDLYILRTGEPAKGSPCSCSCTWRSPWSPTTCWCISPRSARRLRSGLPRRRGRPPAPGTGTPADAGHPGGPRREFSQKPATTTLPVM